MTQTVIRAALKKLELLLLNRGLNLDLARMNLGIGVGKDDFAAKRVDFAGAVIRNAQRRAASGRGGTLQGAAAVRKSNLCSPQALLDTHMEA